MWHNIHFLRSTGNSSYTFGEQRFTGKMPKISTCALRIHIVWISTAAEDRIGDYSEVLVFLLTIQFFSVRNSANIVQILCEIFAANYCS